MAALRCFNPINSLSFAMQEFRVVPQTSATQHQMAVIVGEAFRHPESASVCRFREVPRTKFKRTQSFHVPNVEELVRDCTERIVVYSRICERAAFNNLGRGQMFHTITGAIV